MGPKLKITSAHIWLKVTMTISKLMSSALNDFPAWESFINASFQQKFEKQFISRLDLDPVPSLTIFNYSDLEMFPSAISQWHRLDLSFHS